MNFNISALVYRDEKKRRTLLQMFTLTQEHGEDCHFLRKQPAIISGKVTTGALTSSTDQSK